MSVIKEIVKDCKDLSWQNKVGFTMFLVLVIAICALFIYVGGWIFFLKLVGISVGIGVYVTLTGYFINHK